MKCFDRRRTVQKPYNARPFSAPSNVTKCTPKHFNTRPEMQEHQSNLRKKLARIRGEGRPTLNVNPKLMSTLTLKELPPYLPLLPLPH